MEEPRQTYSFDIHTHVYDYHDSAYALVIHLDREVATRSLTTRTFRVRARLTDEAHADRAVFFDGERTVTGIYASRTGAPGERDEAGTHVVIELRHGPNEAEAVLCPYRADTYRQSACLTAEYAVEQMQPAGSALPTGARFVQRNLRTDTVDQFSRPAGGDVLYRLFAPRMAPGERYPLVVWLHGFGERGSDGETPLRSNRGGVYWAEPDAQRRHPCFVMAAQATAPTAWGARTDSDERMVDALLRDLDEVVDAHPQIDRDRVYICGLSSGGHGAWSALVKDPDRFAAALPMSAAYFVADECGHIDGARAEKLRRLTDKPILMIHGVGDPAVDIRRTADPIYRFLSEEVGNPNVRYIRMRDVSYAGRAHYTMHNTEVRVFNDDVVFQTSLSDGNPLGDECLPARLNDPDLTVADWLFAQRR